MQELKRAPSGAPLRDNIGVMEFYGVYPQDLLSVFEPRDFPPRECKPITRRRTLAEVFRMIRGY